MGASAGLGRQTIPWGLPIGAGVLGTVLAFADRAGKGKFVPAALCCVVLLESDPAALLARFETYEPPRVVKWINAGTI